MSKKFILASVLFDEWRKDPEYVKAYDVLDDESARAQMVIGSKVDDLKRSN
jgi:hypothetical protein